MSNRIEINRAEWDLIPKTKFLRVEGTLITKLGDKVIAEVAEPQGINPKILLINLRVDSTNRVNVPFASDIPIEFNLSLVTNGNEAWEKVQVKYQDESETKAISKIDGLDEINNIKVRGLMGMKLRAYKTGDSFTDEFVNGRVNIETDNNGLIKSIWRG